jgi:hypothetical protein
MLMNIFLGAFLLLVTCGIHLLGMIFVMHLLRLEEGPIRMRLRRVRAYLVGEVVLVMAFASILEALLWAIAYLALGEIKDLEPAFYFSMVTFTTLGYGDIVLDESWRLVASFQAATGIIMFGWTTAILIAVVQHSYFGKNLGDKPGN